MSLNNIQLNPSLLADLYRSSLVETLVDTNESPQPKGKKQIVSMQSSATVEPGPQAEHKESSAWKCLGEFKKSILIIVRYNNAPYLPDKQLNFLTSVLNACKLNLGDVAILNAANGHFSHKDLQEKFKSRFTILFGLTPEEFEMPLSFPEFQVQAFNNCTFLHTPVLEALETDKGLKGKLWVCLKKMFGV
jgi:hypothetical protein